MPAPQQTKLNTIMKRNILMVMVAAAGITAWGAAPKVGELSNVRRLTSELSMKYENPRFSPDGSRVSFTEFGYDGLYVINADGTGLLKLTSEPGVGFCYQWNAEGSEILVRGTRKADVATEGAPRMHFVARVDVAGKGIERVGQEAANMLPPVWRYNGGSASVTTGQGLVKTAARNGRKLNLPAGVTIESLQSVPMFRTSFQSDSEHLYAIGAEGVARSIYDGGAFCAQLSPDGKRVAFCTDLDEIKVMNIDGSNVVTLGKGFAPAWVNDGQLIVERTTDDGHIYKSGELFLVNIATAQFKAITATPGRIEMNACVSPDGSKLLFTDFNDGQVYIADLK